MTNETTPVRCWNARLVSGHDTTIPASELEDLAWRFCAFLLERCPSPEERFKNDAKVSAWEEAKSLEGGEFHKNLFLGCLRASYEVYGPRAVLEEHARELDTAEARKSDLFYQMVMDAWREVVSAPRELVADSRDTQRLCGALLQSLHVILYPNHRKTRTILSLDREAKKVVARLATHRRISLGISVVPKSLPDSLLAEAATDFSRGATSNPTRRAKTLTMAGTHFGAFLDRDDFEYLAGNDGQEIVVDGVRVPFPLEIARFAGRFLASRHLMARCFEPSVATREEQPWSLGDKGLVYLGDPSQTLRFDLVERMFFADILPQILNGSASVRVFDNIDRRGFLVLLASGDYALLHFSGHGGISAGGVPFLLLAGNERVSPMDLAAAKQRTGSPELVILNACLTAATDIREVDDDSISEQGGAAYETFHRGFASAFLALGTRAFVGTLWPVADRCAAKFALEFYRFLFGNQMDVDESLWLAKRRLLGQKDTVDALAYVLFKSSPADNLIYLTKKWRIGDPLSKWSGPTA